ncbi:MAG: hypothetical protein IMY80_08775 [Chloroflexi bacterium]|nr:hypothetical protein [Chloroflexota bacterium]
MKLIRFLTVAAMLAALFVFAKPVAAGIIGSSRYLVFPIAVAELCT